jgi:hypothetical protein
MGALLAPLDLVDAASMFDFVSIGLREIAVAALCGGVCGYYGAKWALTSPAQESTF